MLYDIKVLQNMSELLIFSSKAEIGQVAAQDICQA